MTRFSTAKTQKSRTPLVIGVLFIVAIGLAGIAWMATGGGGKSAPIATSAAPIVTASVSQSLEAFRGKVVILDIWATWCPPCRMEIPDFVKLQEKYRDQGVEIIGVSIDPIDPRGGGAPAVAPFMQQYKINYHVWMVNSPTALTGYPMGQGIPTTYVIDRNGRISKTYVGAKAMSVFESDIKELL
jgi:thiol-disulfide isomerase/thioredoxin